MTSVVRLTTTVLPGGRLELVSPELPEGRQVTVEVRVPAPTPGFPAVGVVDWLLLPRPSTRSPEEWEQFERDFRAERESWDEDFDHRELPPWDPIAGGG